MHTIKCFVCTNFETYTNAYVATAVKGGSRVHLCKRCAEAVFVDERVTDVRPWVEQKSFCTLY